MRQDQALYLMGQGKSVFLTGPAGSGKTYVLNKFIKDLKRRKKQVAITASTGIAATHLNGTTIHSWSGLGIRDELTSRDRAWLAGNAKLNKRYNATDVLIIDEVSMLHGKRLDMVNEACKLLRQSDEPFGGLQVILTGDLFQLPPVNRGGGSDDFAHMSDAWAELNLAICYLSEQHRQSSGALLNMLQAMRSAEIDDGHIDMLTERINTIPDDDVTITRLFAHNVDVDNINDRQLEKLPGKIHTFNMDSSGRSSSVEQLQKSVLAPETLELKVGAEVMFVANNFVSKFANGTRGQVVDFGSDGFPLIKLHSNGRTIKAEAHSWSREEDGKVRAQVSQLPLRLAWAITIHKSQGMSLDHALIDLSQTFTYGMGYVALSRVRSLEGLFIIGINDMALQLHPAIFEYDVQLREVSQKLADEVGEVTIVDEPPSTTAEDYDTGLYKKLRLWRSKRASIDEMPAYIVAHDKTLEEVARRKPQSLNQLLSVNGFGPKKVEQYGPEIIELILQK
jgi:ATP-dependent exoDNAse (exonuclease V) alpha subunit